MREYTRKLTSVDLTGKEMHRLARQYAMDVAPYASLPLPVFFDKVKRINYRRDPDGEEYLSRALAVLEPWARENSRGNDCDQKAITMAAWAVLNEIPYRFVAVSRQPYGKLSHVYTEFFMSGKWVPVDATYPRNTLFYPMRNYPKRVVLKSY